MEANNKAMREALEEISEIVQRTIFLYGDFPAELHDIFRKAQSALAAPPRNCDVGTAEEQVGRWEEFCTHHHKKMIGNKIPLGPCECPCYEGNSCNFFIWAQMPYDESEDSHGNA